ncbi:MULTISPECIES: 4-phosphoerythronate dehydrogenase PdxB [unclassified Neptuniibacter]|uniref:4-phosphoerythronate dehydrogenase PdxB n=1 Tax=unclassified Neptuniibacter TaxID=2630693 RepID=UPI0025E7A3BA|nr:MULTISPECIES: 4-phosphoerythronate dehydrogenase PdxB [unclassified Neptuniibacter]
MLNRKLNILADENMPQVEAIFSRFGEVTLKNGREFSAEDLSEIDVLLVRSITQVNESLLGGSPVQFVGTATIGTDHIDHKCLQSREIAFSNAPGCNADAVVEYVLSNLLLIAEHQGFDPKDRTFGIVGVGNVGGRLQKRLQALGYKILLNDPLREKNEEDFVGLNEVLRKADVICLHTPLTDKGEHPTHHLISGSELARVKENAIIINAGRGPVIDNAALLQVGKKRLDLTFVLDVWEHEPLVDAELAERCAIVTPHIAGYSYDGKVRGTYMLYQALCKHLGEPCEKTLDDFLPVAELANVEQGELTPLELTQKVYDPRIDDYMLRQTLALPESEKKQAFDQLRKQYRIRREFASLSVSGATNPKQLEAIGFKLAAEG